MKWSEGASFSAHHWLSNICMILIIIVIIMFLLILWEFHTMCFDQIHLLSQLSP
jgi:lipoprotein signal peptidase